MSIVYRYTDYLFAQYQEETHIHTLGEATFYVLCYRPDGILYRHHVWSPATDKIISKFYEDNIERTQSSYLSTSYKFDLFRPRNADDYTNEKLVTQFAGCFVSDLGGEGIQLSVDIVAPTGAIAIKDLTVSEVNTVLELLNVNRLVDAQRIFT